jgi:hypothetical protein
MFAIAGGPSLAGSPLTWNLLFARQPEPDLEFTEEELEQTTTIRCVGLDRRRRLCRDGAGNDHGLCRAASRRIAGPTTTTACRPKASAAEASTTHPDRSAPSHYSDSTPDSASRDTAGCSAADSRSCATIRPTDADGLSSDRSSTVTSTGIHSTHHGITNSAVRRRTAGQCTRKSNEPRSKSGPSSGCRRDTTGAGDSAWNCTYDS